MSPEALRAASLSFKSAAQFAEAGGENTKSLESRFERRAPTRAAALAMRSTRASASRPPQPPPPQQQPLYPRRSQKLQVTLRPHRSEPLPPFVTPRQATRYTHLFVTNRGSLCEQEEFIHGYTTRELWQRSRLPDRVLEQVWAYADAGGKGVLTREEFVLGMWLVDGCLAGRKVPSVVNSPDATIE